MAITFTEISTNSGVIDFSKDASYEEILDKVHDFITTHGWEVFVDTTWNISDPTVEFYQRVYRAPNIRGGYKYIKLSYNTTGQKGFNCHVYEDFDSIELTGTNQCLVPNTYGLTQKWQPNYNGGKFYLFASERWFIWQIAGAYWIGTNYGKTFAGCVEIQAYEDLDTSPDFALVMGYYLANSPVLSPPSTPTYNNTDAPVKLRINTLVGTWGNTQAANQETVISKNIDPLHGKHQVYDMNVVYDCDTIDIYTKGKLYGLKAIGVEQFLLGDIMRIKCDIDFFVDPAGTEKHFFALTGTDLSFAIPL